ncbi:MAG: DUF6800 family protein [Planctomycetaceae bacterium]
MGGIIERQKELRRRRKRAKAYEAIARKAAKASATEKAVLAAKVRRMTTGAETVIENLGLTAK